MALIFILSATPDLRVAPDPLADYVLRKLGHLAVFGVLAVLVAWAWSGPRPEVLGFAVAVGYGILDELHQAGVAGRVGDPLDVAIDAAGAAMGVTVWAWWDRRRVDTRAGRH
jgi:VanZ family protein